MPADDQHHPAPARLAHARRARARAIPARLLALAACALLLLLALAAAGLNAPPSAQGRALVPSTGPTPTPTATDTPTSTPTPTATPVPGTLTLVSPSYASGPAGAHVTVSGSGFSGGSLTLKAATHADCSSPQATLASLSSASGSFTQSFIWPTGLPNATYYLCANGTTSGPTYQQLATSAPALSLSAPSAAQESQLVISGSNFVGLPAGSSIQLTATQGTSQATITPSGVVDANGQFTVPWTVDVSLTGTVVISAQSAPEGTAPPVLQATASVTITPPATATSSATSSASPTSAGVGGTGTSSGGSNGGGGLVVLLIVLLIVVLLVGGGAAAYLLLRRRGADGPQAPYPPDGSRYPGYSPYGPSSPGWDQTASTERMGGGMWPSGQYGGMGTGPGTGSYGMPGGYSGVRPGAVSQWDETAEEYGDEPSAGWQPRPMTGYGGFSLSPETEQSGSYAPAPADPWGATGGGYGDPAGGYSGTQGGTGYGGYGGYGGDDGSWRNQAGGPGATRPDSGPPERYSRQPSPDQYGQGQAQYGQGQGQAQGPYGQNQYGQGQYGQQQQGQRQGQGQYGQAPGAGWPDEAPGGGSGRPPDDWRR